MEQFDTLVGELTVTEMLMYTAELKRSHHEPLQVVRMTAPRQVLLSVFPLGRHVALPLLMQDLRRIWRCAGKEGAGDPRHVQVGTGPVPQHLHRQCAIARHFRWRGLQVASLEACC